MLCAMCLAGMGAPSGLRKVHVKAAQSAYKVLIWSTVLRDVDAFYEMNIKKLQNIYAVDLASEEMNIDVTMKYSTSQLHPEHFDGTETLADEYDLIWVYLPYFPANDNDIKVLKEYVNAGGRIVLQSENIQNFKGEDANLTKIAQSLGTSFSIGTDAVDISEEVSADYINTDSDLLEGKALEGNALSFRYFANIIYQEPAEVIASYQNMPVIVDQALDQGRITILSDIDMWRTYDNESSKALLRRFLLNSRKNKEKVQNGENPNEGFGKVCQLKAEMTALEKKWTEWTDSEDILSSKEDVEVTIAGSDTVCGLQGIAYYLSTEKLTKEQVEALTADQWKELVMTRESASFTLSQEGKTIVYAKISDNKGNICYLASNVIQIDKTQAKPSEAPKTTPSPKPSEAPKPSPSVLPSEVPAATPSIPPVTTPTTMPTESPALQPTIEPLKDPAITPAPEQKDITSPTGKIIVENDSWSSYQEKIAFSHFYKTAVKVRIEANDEESGVQTISYYISDKALKTNELSGLKWRTYVSWFSLYPDMRGIIYAKLQDATGNVTYLSTDGLVIEAPYDKTDIWKYEEVKKVETVIYAQKNDKDIQGSFYNKIRAQANAAQKKTITLKWQKVQDADGYIVYGNRCNTKGHIYKMKKLKTLPKQTIVKWSQKKLKKGTYYKYLVVAYKNIAGKKKTLSVSKTVHAITQGGKYQNPKKVKLSKQSFDLKAGKTKKLKAARIMQKHAKMKEHVERFRYEVTDKKIATVTKKGVVKAKKAGDCYVYVYVQNGIKQRAKIHVK